jgi:hypothetical protein
MKELIDIGIYLIWLYRWGGNGFCMVNDYGGQVKSSIGCRGRVDGGEI